MSEEGDADDGVTDIRFLEDEAEGGHGGGDGDVGGFFAVSGEGGVGGDSAEGEGI